MAQVVAEGHLNAIAFWFDLHLDDQVSITSAPAGFGIGGVAEHFNPNPPADTCLGEASEDRTGGATAESVASAAASASTKSASAAAGAAAMAVTAPHVHLSRLDDVADSQGTCMLPHAAGAADTQGMDISPVPAGAADSQASCMVHAAAASTPEASASESAAACAPHTTQADTAEASDRQQGTPAEPAPDAPGNIAHAADCDVPAGLRQGPVPGAAPCAGAAVANPAGLGQGAVAGSACGAGAIAERCEADERKEGDSGGDAESHYWGQAMQYLDCSTRVAPGELHMLL